jgi:hypothetical protein
MNTPWMSGPLLAYLFWHWPRPGAPIATYEADLLNFHASLAARPPRGFVRSATFAADAASWFPGPRDSYEDWYLVQDWAALGGLNRAAVGPVHAGRHDQVAHQAAGGTAGLYALHTGNDAAGQTAAAWFAKPPGWSYGELFAALDGCLEQGSALWQRQLTLGPAPEFCLRATTRPALPPPLDAEQASYRLLS